MSNFKLIKSVTPIVIKLSWQLNVCLCLDFLVASHEVDDVRINVVIG